MEKLTKEQLDSLEFKAKSLKTAHPAVTAFLKEAANLLVGEALKVTKVEWPLKGVPQISRSRIKLSKYGIVDHAKFRTLTLADDSGWVVTRVE